MRLIEFTRSLFEMPLRRFRTQGFDQSGGAYDPQDVRLVNSSRFGPRLVKAFRHTPFDIEVVLVNSGWMRNQALDQLDDERLDREDWNKQFGVFIRNLPTICTRAELAKMNRLGYRIEHWIGQQARDRSIVAVIHSNLNPAANRIPMTPWIIAHRIGHGIWDAVGRGAYKFSPEVNQIGSNIYQSLNELDSSPERQNDADVMFDMFLRKYGTMRSVRSGILGRDEGWIEAFSQYVIDGTIQLDGPRDEINLTPSDRKWTSGLIRRIQIDLNQFMHTLLTQIQGKIIIGV